MIDWDRVAELQAEVGEDAIREIMALFVDEVGEAVSRLRDCRDATEIAERLHFLKGSAQNIGFDELSALCAGEERAVNGDASHEVDIEGLRKAFGRAIGELSSLMD